MPKVSVTIPVHNAAPYLRECLDSVLDQTLQDIEVFCVDDGSTDGSAEILEAYALKDPRLTAVRQLNSGAGVARNTGLDMASGEYLSFLDADDVFDPTMLEEMYGTCVADRADVGICKVNYLDTTTGEVRPADGILKCALLPDKVPFSREDMPDRVLSFVSPAAWNKMFRRDFVAEHGLRFQEIRRANDFLFTKLALVKAERITIIDRALVNYRVGMDSNLQASNHETPTEFHAALLALRSELVDSGVFPSLERSFVNEALSNCLYNLSSMRWEDSFSGLYHLLRDVYFEELGIAGRPRDYFFTEQHYEQYLRITSSSPAEYLFDEMRTLRTELRASRDQLKNARAQLVATQKKLKKIKKSRAYRIGQRIAAVPRFFRRMLTPRDAVK